MPLRRLYLELTSRCNLACSMCYRGTWSDGEADMAPEPFQSIQSRVLGPECPGTVALGGIGEPSVSPLFMLAHSYPEYVLGRSKAVLARAFGDARTAALSSIRNGGAYGGFRRTVLANRYPSCPDCDLMDGCDLRRDTSAGCHAASPSRADCPWSRGFTLCP